MSTIKNNIDFLADNFKMMNEKVGYFFKTINRSKKNYLFNKVDNDQTFKDSRAITQLSITKSLSESFTSREGFS